MIVASLKVLLILSFSSWETNTCCSPHELRNTDTNSCLMSSSKSDIVSYQPGRGSHERSQQVVLLEIQCLGVWRVFELLP